MRKQKEFIIEDLSFVKFIALNEWSKSRLVLPENPNEGTLLEDLYRDYLEWVIGRPDWSTHVLVNKSNFGRQLGQLLSAKGWPFSWVRKASGRTLVGASLHRGGVESLM